jgi:hypothetical protein
LALIDPTIGSFGGTRRTRVAAVEALLRRHANDIADFDPDSTAACLAIL